VLTVEADFISRLPANQDLSRKGLAKGGCCHAQGQARPFDAINTRTTQKTFAELESTATWETNGSPQIRTKSLRGAMKTRAPNVTAPTLWREDGFGAVPRN